MKRKWREVYERLPEERRGKTLAEIGGFTNFCEPSMFRLRILQNLLREFEFEGKANICEVGCGAGDKLKFFYDLGHLCHGVDYSKAMVNRARKEMPKASFFIKEAIDLPFKNNSMDFVFSYSVFIYFESKRYSNNVLSEMYRIAKPNSTICVWDVPDIKESNNVMKIRGKPKKGYEHTYYDMNYFIQWFKDKDIKSVKAEYIPFPEYRWSNHRFNITARINKDE